MFARIVSLQLKPNASTEFAKLLEEKLVPILRKQKGFKDELVFVEPGGPDMLAISLWESRENAEAYERQTYPELVKMLGRLIERTPTVKTYELNYSTLHKLGAAAFATQSPITTPVAGVGG